MVQRAVINTYSIVRLNLLQCRRCRRQLVKQRCVVANAHHDLAENGVPTDVFPASGARHACWHSQQRGVWSSRVSQRRAVVCRGSFTSIKYHYSSSDPAVVKAIKQWLNEPENTNKLHTIEIVLSGIFVALYVWDTYYPAAWGTMRQQFDLVMCIGFAIEFFIRVTVARKYFGTRLKVWSLVDFLSFGPPLLATAVEFFAGASISRIDLRWCRIFRALRVVRLSLLYSNFTKMHLSGSSSAILASAVSLRMFQLISSIAVLIFTTASLLQVLERIPWHDALYLVFTTLTTVGYGDVVAQTVLGRIAVLVMIALGVVFIPVQTTLLYNQLSTRRVILGHLPRQKTKTVLVSTRMSEVRAFADFFQEFSHALQTSNVPKNIRMVCLTGKPSFEVRAFQEINEQRLTVVQGSMLNEHDLIRTRAEKAEACMVLADRFSPDAINEDLAAQFSTWAFKSYTKSVPLYVQVIQRSAMKWIAPFLDARHDVILSIEQTRHRLLALSCLCPGASTLIANILRVAPVSDGVWDKRTLAGRHWLNSYVRGCAFEMCETGPIGTYFVDVPFIHAAEFLHRAAAVVLMGVIDTDNKVQLNPGMRAFKRGERAIVLARSQDQANAALLMRYSPHESFFDTDDIELDDDGAASLNGGGVDDFNDTRWSAALKGMSRGLECDSLDLDDISESVVTSSTTSMDDDDYFEVDELLYPTTASASGSFDEFAAPSQMYGMSLLAGNVMARSSMQEALKGSGAACVLPPVPRRLRSSANESVDYDTSNLNLNAMDRPLSPGSSVAKEIEWTRQSGHDVAGAQEIAGLTNHIIISGHAESFVSFVAQLRQCDSDDTPLVILHPSRLDEAVWSTLALMGRVYWVQGSPTDAAALKGARSKHARSLVYLAQLTRPKVVDIDAADAQYAGVSDSFTTSLGAVLKDAEALLTCYGVGEESTMDATHVVVELCFTSSIRFLQPGLLLQGSLPTQVQQTLKIPRRSWRMRTKQERACRSEGLAEWQANPYYCSGHVTVPALLDSFSCQCFLNKGRLLDFMTELCGDDGRPSGTILRLNAVPRSMVGRTYGELFTKLTLQHNMVPLGLYRRKSENQAWRLRYVATNPGPMDKLERSDFVYVLVAQGLDDQTSMVGVAKTMADTFVKDSVFTK